MPAPGFGFSTGDFIAVIQLLIQAHKALQDANGAAADFQQHVTWLESLIIVLQQLQESPHDEIKPLADTCYGPLLEFWKNIKKYEKDLGVNGVSTPSGTARMSAMASTAKIATSKLRWALGSASNDVVKLREAIGHHLVVINSKLGLQTLFVGGLSATMDSC